MPRLTRRQVKRKNDQTVRKYGKLFLMEPLFFRAQLTLV
jgi:hypothetical protein